MNRDLNQVIIIIIHDHNLCEQYWQLGRMDLFKSILIFFIVAQSCWQMKYCYVSESNASVSLWY